MSDIIIVIPAFQPDARLVHLVRELTSTFFRVVVIDDGSRGCDGVFDSIGASDKTVLLRHDSNRGKGIALKTGFSEVLRRFPDVRGVITADADGQHRIDDIRRVADALCFDDTRLVLGVRSFGKDIPFRSRLGNLWTIAEFAFLTGRFVKDTQTGLRGIPQRQLPELMQIPGTRYDYEIRMLVRAVATGGGVTQIPIATIYDHGNDTSHYRPLADTFETQRALFTEAFKYRFRAQ